MSSRDDQRQTEDDLEADHAETLADGDDARQMQGVQVVSQLSLGRSVAKA